MSIKRGDRLVMTIKGVSEPVVGPTNQVTDDRTDLSAVHATCPVCRETNVTATVASEDSNLRVLRVRLVCSHAHEWEVELPQPPRTS
jgi:hypothetical protein